MKLFWRLIVRPLRRERVRTGLTALAVALGVAVVLAIEMAGGAAAGSFQSSVETLVGDADFEVTATGGVPASTVATLAGLPYALGIRARVEDYATLVGTSKTVPLIGVDMLADAQTASATDAEQFQHQDAIWVGSGLGLRVGDHVRLAVNDGQGDYVVRGTLGNSSGDVVVMDLAPVSRLLHRNGSVDRVLVKVPKSDPRSLDAWEAVLQRALPGVTVARQGARTNENRRMLGAFRWNLRVLSYVALVVGAFLIYNTISVSVVRRRAEIGIARALGATRGQVLAAFLGEAACFGVFGGLAGLALGRALAEGAVGLLAITVQSLYVSSTPGRIELSWGIAALAMIAGIGVAVLSALAPALEASRVAPVEAMARGRREHEARMQKGFDLILAAGMAVLAWTAAQRGPVEGKPLFGYLATVLLIGASTFAIPALVAGVSSLVSGWAGRLFGVEAMLASRSLGGSLRRTSVLVGALATAIAMMAAVGIMVGSFRETVLLWMDDRLVADLYLRPAVPVGADRHPTLGKDVEGRLRLLPEVDAVDTFRAYEISYDGRPATLAGGDARIAAKYGRRPLLSGSAGSGTADQLRSGDFAIVSEPFANKHGVKRGDVLDVPMGGHPVKLKVLDIYYDYSSERGYIIVDRTTLLKYLPDEASSNIGIYLKPGIDLDAGKRSVEAALAGRKVAVFSNRTLRADAIQIFDRTFAITYALEAVAIVVAIMGVAGALLALVIDRRREFGLLRFLGGAQGQLRRMILFEAGLLGLLANLAGVALGILLSLILIYVINKQSFGWTIQFHWPVAGLLGALTGVYLATVLAGLYPAKVAMELNPIEVIHED